MASYKELFSAGSKRQGTLEDPQWDTGICTVCRQELSDDDRTAAVFQMAYFGWGYACENCLDNWLFIV